MMTNTASLFSDFWQTEEQIIHFGAIAWEDHSYVATWQDRSRNGKSWNISLNAEGIQRPLNPRKMRLPTWFSHKMEILSFLQGDTFIIVITQATKQRLEVKSKLGFVANTSWTEQFLFFFFNCSEMSFRFLTIDEEWTTHQTCTRFSDAQLFHRLVFICCQGELSHIDAMQLLGSSHEAH